MATSLSRRLLGILCILTLLLGLIPLSASAADSAELTTAGGWFETIYAEIPGISASSVTAVSYSGTANGGLDAEGLRYLVRDKADGNGVRVDIPGVKAGTYALTIVAGGTTYSAENITVMAYDRSGYAHYNYTEGVGAYNDDGTLKENARVIYVTDENKDTVPITFSRYGDEKTIAGIGNILNSNNSSVNQGLLEFLSREYNEPLVVRFIGTVTQPQGVSEFRQGSSNGSMVYMLSGANITLEGIGPDATIDGWGFSFGANHDDTQYSKQARNFEVRNLSFRNVPEDCIEVTGYGNSDGTIKESVEHAWIHNNAFYVPSIDTPAEDDKAQGDGAVDFKWGYYMTMSYNYFDSYHKTSLVGGADENQQYHVTWHHNYFKGIDQRAPLARQADMHIYNNYYVDGQKNGSSYCMSLRANTYIFSEYNTFVNCQYPMKDEKSGGVAKSWQDEATGCSNTADLEKFKVTDKSQTVTSANEFANFDTNAELSYIPSGDYLLDTDHAVALAKIKAYAGPMKETIISPDDVKDEGTTYSFYASDYSDKTDQEAAAGTVGTEDFFTIGGTAKWRGSPVNYVDLEKGEAGTITFKVPKDAVAQSVTINCASTGGSNESIVGILDSENKLVTTTGGAKIGTCVGTASTSVSYANLGEGTYRIVVPTAATAAPESVPSRNTRIYSVTVVIVSTEEAPTLSVSPAAVTVAKGDSATVTVTTDAATVTASSDKTGIASASAAGKVVTITGVAAGTATVTVTAENDAGKTATATIKVTVTDDTTVVTGTYTFDATGQGEQTGDKINIPDGALVGDDGFFTVTNSGTDKAMWRTNSSNVTTSLELGSKGSGTMKFTVPDGTVAKSVTINFSSTGGSNYSALVLRNSEDEVVYTSANTRIGWQVGTSSTSVGYRDLSAGAYRIEAPSDVEPEEVGLAGFDSSSSATNPNTRGVRIYSIEVVIAADSSATVVPVQSVSLDRTTAEIAVDETLTLTATVSPENATDKTVAWASSDSSIASVANGTITGKSAGTATITATAGGKSATCTVTVTENVAPNVPVTGVSLDRTTAEIAVDETLTLTGTVSPENATDKTVAWASSDSSIASVANGTVTGKSAGTATITATAGGKSATCTVTVTAKTSGGDVGTPATKITITGPNGAASSTVTVNSRRDQTIQLSAAVAPEEAKQDVAWSSDKDDITVDDAGLVTVLKTAKAGTTAIITATAQDGSDVTATYTIRVIAASGGGSSTGGSSSGGSTGGSASGNTGGTTGSTTGGGTTAPGTVTNPDGSTTKTETKTDGTVVETTTREDGTVTETVTASDGAKTETVTEPDGDVTITATRADGEVVAKVEIPATIPALENKFEDVPAGHWAESAINTMAALGVINGVSTEDHVFDVNSNITRGAMAQILFNLSQGKEGKAESFGDVAEGAWYTDAVAWAADAGIVTGYSENTFAPEDSITREQLAVMLYRYARLLGMDTGAQTDMNRFVDNSSVSDWAGEAMAWAVGSGIITGKGDDNLDPGTSATRAETAVMFDRFLALV